MKNSFYILILVLAFSSCSEYQKALKSENIATKYRVGEDLYNAGKFSKANRLFEQAIPQYRGKPQAERLMFLNADASYQMENYFVSGYHFERFVSAYPKSTKKEEALFKAAKSYYQLSPVYSKDQGDTNTALEKLQEYINVYPESKNATEANALVKELSVKLEKKAFEIAKQYNRISDFKASISSIDHFIIDFPGTAFREEALYIKFDSEYQLASRSVEYKKKARLEAAVKFYNAFKKVNPNSEFLEDATTKYENTLEQLKKYNTKS
ncbi:outer membrane protein assembly factor BamD [Lacinutrix jangbogonensis]|uniref:outer membrane protein assembly factor BamD n=1 Tax=Lacinutrix jangbogonensis TaxID=1469557 RepID=UPI00053CEFE8|nr:outer membrane protein assembly factor BamD [Lacinutrix jangbogonensis]